MLEPVVSRVSIVGLSTTSRANDSLAARRKSRATSRGTRIESRTDPRSANLINVGQIRSYRKAPLMNLRILQFVAVAVILWLSAKVSMAVPITWTIDSSVSQLTMTIPNQIINLPNGPVMLYTLNQTGPNTTWTVGNHAFVGGTIPTNYTDGSSITFFPVDSIVGLNSGSYRPNTAVYDPNALPFPKFTDTSLAPAVFGMKFNANLAFDVSYASFPALNFEMGSLQLPLSGVPLGTQTFNPNAMSFGTTGLFAYDGVSVPGLGVVTPDFLTGSPLSDTINSTGSAAAIVAPDPIGQPLLRRMTTPIRYDTHIDMGGGVFVEVLISGTIVSTAIVPEPSSLALGCAAFAGLALYLCRRSRRCGSLTIRNR